NCSGISKLLGQCFAGWGVVGGTSASAPIIGSVYALAGNASSVTYGSYPYSHTAGLFDVTSGSNGSCGGTYLCTGVAGYDGPTGLGTPNGASGFGTAAPASDFAINAAPANRTVAAGAGTTYDVTLTSTGGFSAPVNLSVARGPA